MLEGNLNPDASAQVIGVRAQMEIFEYFGVFACELVLNHGDNLLAVLQARTLTVAKSQRVASLAVTMLA